MQTTTAGTNILGRNYEGELASLRLNPVISSNTSRYDYSGRIEPCSLAIARGPASHRFRTTPTLKWSRFVHPEGQPYFVLNDGFDFTVVTEAYVDDTQIETQILDYSNLANRELYDHNIKIPPRCELFLELAQDRSCCNYYFVDHVAKELFWLENVCAEFLGIPAAVSYSHLGKALEKLYWVHIEYFPMHHTSHEQEFGKFVNELYDIISHGQADRLTSRTSTFPYTADTCTYFLDLLSRKRGQPVDGYTLCYAARLAGTISNQRFSTFYGQRPAQLDRLQEMCPADPIEHKWMLATANLLMWGIPQNYISKLEELFVNEQVYADHWTNFVSLCLSDWAGSLSWCCPVLIASILLANVRGGTVSLSIPSVLSCAVSITSASCLHLRHQSLADSSATVGACYLRAAKSDTTRFIRSSVAFSLPRASYLWGLGFLTAQCIFVASHATSKLVALLAACGIALLLTFVLCVIYPEEANVTTLFRSLVSMCNPRIYDLETRQGQSIV